MQSLTSRAGRPPVALALIGAGRSSRLPASFGQDYEHNTAMQPFDDLLRVVTNRTCQNALLPE